MSTSSSSGGMIPYLHFSAGDYLYFRTWQPTSSGAIAGACLGLVVLALIERWIAAMRSVFDAHWRRRALALTKERDEAKNEKILAHLKSSLTATDKTKMTQADIEESSREVSSEPQRKMYVLNPRGRTIMPFIPSHDIPRGLFYALQMLVLYLLMLAVMTFQAAFIVSILLGLGLGELLFGRVASVGAFH